MDEASEICEAFATGIFKQGEIAEALGTTIDIVGKIIRNTTKQFEYK